MAYRRIEKKLLDLDKRLMLLEKLEELDQVRAAEKEMDVHLDELEKKVTRMQIAIKRKLSRTNRSNSESSPQS